MLYYNTWAEDGGFPGTIYTQTGRLVGSVDVCVTFLYVSHFCIVCHNCMPHLWSLTLIDMTRLDHHSSRDTPASHKPSSLYFYPSLPTPLPTHLPFPLTYPLQQQQASNPP